MRPIRIALLGALLLCAVASLTACSTSGETRKPPHVVESRLIEVPRRQLVQVSGELTAKPALPPAPAPAVPAGSQGCTRAAGCFSNRQLESMLTTALSWGERMADQLDTIRRLMSEAINAEGNPP